MEKRGLFLITIALIYISIGGVFAFNFEDPVYGLTGEEPTSVTFNNNTGAVNSTDNWNTNLGPLDNVNSTQFENNGGTLSIIQGWIQGLIDMAKIWENLTGTTKMITPQDVDMQDKNIEDVTNITLIDSIKDSDSNSRVYFNVNGTFVVEG